MNIVLCCYKKFRSRIILLYNTINNDYDDKKYNSAACCFCSYDDVLVLVCMLYVCMVVYMYVYVYTPAAVCVLLLDDRS